MFDSVTACLVECGQVCIDRLSGFVMDDIAPTMDDVFTHVWIDDGNQMKVVSKCFELWELKHVKNGMSKVEKSFINDLRKKYWSLFKNKNSKLLVSSYF